MGAFEKNMDYFEKYRIQIENLAIEKGRKMTLDGPISDKYSKADPKITWVLREPNGGGGGSLID